MKQAFVKASLLGSYLFWIKRKLLMRCGRRETVLKPLQKVIFLQQRTHYSGGLIVFTQYLCLGQELGREEVHYYPTFFFFFQFSNFKSFFSSDSGCGKHSENCAGPEIYYFLPEWVLGRHAIENHPLEWRLYESNDFCFFRAVPSSA